VSRYLGTEEENGESILPFNGSGQKQWGLSEGFFDSTVEGSSDMQRLVVTPY
jgi:hypothetical protein